VHWTRAETTPSGDRREATFFPAPKHYFREADCSAGSKSVREGQAAAGVSDETGGGELGKIPQQPHLKSLVMPRLLLSVGPSGRLAGKLAVQDAGGRSQPVVTTTERKGTSIQTFPGRN